YTSHRSCSFYPAAAPRHLPPFPTRRSSDLELLGTRGGPEPELTELVTLGVNHEEQHQELILTDVKHLLSRNPIAPAYGERWPLTAVRERKLRWIPIPGGAYEVGHDGHGFAFDNEGPRHRVLVQDFSL